MNIFTGKHVLIVDDNAAIRTAFRRLLRAEGMTVILAKNGAEACEVLNTLVTQKERLPDCILSDMQMPIMHGLDLLTAIKKTTELNSIPFVLMSSDIESYQKRGYAYGANVCISKEGGNILHALENVFTNAQ